MNASFGKRLRECREALGLSQGDLAKRLETNHSIIGKYERDQVKPTIDVLRKLAQELNTSVSYLMGESKQAQVLKDNTMLKRLNDIAALPQKDQEYILYAIDGLIKAAKLKGL